MKRAIDRRETYTWTHPEDADVQVDYRLWAGPLYTLDLAEAADKVWAKCVAGVRGLELPKDVTAPEGVHVGAFWQMWTPSDICNAVVSEILAKSRLSEDERRD